MSDHKMYSLEYEIDSLSLEEELSVHKIVTDAMKGNAKCREIWMASQTTMNIFLWDDWKDDMIRFSRMFPEVLFILDIAGFEPYDIERVYFQDGKCQKAHVDIQYSDPNDLDWED